MLWLPVYLIPAEWFQINHLVYILSIEDSMEKSLLEPINANKKNHEGAKQSNSFYLISPQHEREHIKAYLFDTYIIVHLKVTIQAY